MGKSSLNNCICISLFGLSGTNYCNLSYDHLSLRRVRATNLLASAGAKSFKIIKAETSEESRKSRKFFIFPPRLMVNVDSFLRISSCFADFVFFCRTESDVVISPPIGSSLKVLGKRRLPRNRPRHLGLFRDLRPCFLFHLLALLSRVHCHDISVCKQDIRKTTYMYHHLRICTGFHPNKNC